MKERQSNFELLRIVAMCMIIAMHYITKGMDIDKLSVNREPMNLMFWLLYAFCTVAVNVYVLISGYFMVDSTWRIGKVLRLWAEVLFYSILVPFVLAAVGVIDAEALDFATIQQIILPVEYEHYWFATAYIMMYLLSPVLAIAVKNLSKKQLQGVIVALLCVFGGFKSVNPYLIPWDKYGCDCIWFICLFLVAGYIRMYGLPFADKKGLCLGIYAGLSVLTFGIAYVSSLVVSATGKFEYYMDMTYCYNYVTVFAAGVCLFCGFMKINITGNKAKKIINRLAGYTFGVYLLHENIAVRQLWPKWLGIENADGKWWQVIHMLFCIAVVFLAGIIVDALRSVIFTKVEAFFKKYFVKKWYLFLVGLLLIVQAVVFLVFRENSYIQIHDNLDLFMAHYQMLKNNSAFFGKDMSVPMLHGISRNLLGSEFLIYNLLYVIFPNFWAYLIGYALKIAVGMFSFILLAKDIYRDRYEANKPIIVLVAASFALIPVFPTYGLAFTSVPLIVWLLRRLYYTKEFKKRLLLYLGVFTYPLVSYFSYHGFFILAYMVCAIVILWVKDKKFPKTTAASVVVLSLGYILWEYRLFGAMLFDDTVTIRTTMEHGHVSLGEALAAAGAEFVKASFHSQDSHTYIVLGVCLIGIITINIGYIRRKECRKILTEPANLIVGWIIFNVIIFGLYQYAPFRELIEKLIPKLNGFEFARTSFFNPFLWYALFAIILVRLYSAGKKAWSRIAEILAVLGLLVVMFVPAMYNDFYYTCYNQAYRIIKHKDTTMLNYREFYSENLFEDIKKDIDYEGEWSAAYGLHPAVLIYNGISTVDGYLGMYSEDYKQQWGRVIAPALENSPSIKDYFEGWGARVSLYSGNDENTYEPVREMKLEDNRLMVDMDELKKLECRYIFSRINFTNADELNLKLLKAYEGNDSPYTIYVFEVQ